jgi:hypothetical protein
VESITNKFNQAEKRISIIKTKSKKCYIQTTIKKKQTSMITISKNSGT